MHHKRHQLLSKKDTRARKVCQAKLAEVTGIPQEIFPNMQPFFREESTDIIKMNKERKRACSGNCIPSKEKRYGPRNP